MESADEGSSDKRAQLLHSGVGTAIMRGSFIGAKEVRVGNLANNGFDPKAFLAKVGAGKTILNLRKASTSSSKETWRIPFVTFKKAGSSSLSYPSKVRKR
jgi:hypothetical protein